MPSLEANTMMIRLLNFDDMVHDGKVIIEAGILFGITVQQMEEWLTAFLKVKVKWEGPYAISDIS